jgi:hypothetical protein
MGRRLIDRHAAMPNVPADASFHSPVGTDIADHTTMRGRAESGMLPSLPHRTHCK